MTKSADPDLLASDLDLHCLLSQDMSYLAREGLNIRTVSLSEVCNPDQREILWFKFL